MAARGNPIACVLYDGTRAVAAQASAQGASSLCVFLAHGRIAPATVVEHLTPHRGDVNAFFLGALQSLCDNCHKAAKAQIESQGYCNDVGFDGLPVDPHHPFNRVGQPP